MDIREIFENRIKIENKVVTIDSLFNNEDRVRKTDYSPPYQRNYVWDDEKATYFIESILLGTEIPPLIYFKTRNKFEVIDGRQRYQTILRFLGNEFKLKKNGLHKLENVGIANKLFKDLGQLQDLFWDTKLRLIEFSFHSQDMVGEENEDLVKREIFKRYNSGITPLKTAEIDKAIYFTDDLNSYIKKRLSDDQRLYYDITSILHFEKVNPELILKKIRQLLVQNQIPIKYYAVKKDTVISKFYDFLFDKIDQEKIVDIFKSFIEKVNLVKEIRSKFPNKNLFNRLMAECLIWAFSILENEGIELKTITEDLTDSLVNYLQINGDAFVMDRSSFAKELYNRYEITSKFFAEHFEMNFEIYLDYNSDFKLRNKAIDPSDEPMVSFDDLRINKPEPTSTAIVDICRQMNRQRFLIRPPYQRNEVINKKKSSSIIESILLGIKLPPIFVYKRKDNISEVLDGQQRLLSILGFIGQPYLDENNKVRYSDKNGYSLHLKNTILSNLHGKKFTQLSEEQREKIENFDLYVIEINYKNNINFEPIDLFVRLNNKPYPIKEDTFEMWNSYISRDVIDTIKSIHSNNRSWFYLRKNNSRMEDENIYTALAYLQYSWDKSENDRLDQPDIYAPYEVEIYRVVNKIILRIRSKNDLSKVLEDDDEKDKFIAAANRLEFDFIRKLKVLLTDGDDDSVITLNRNLDEIFMIENGRRTQQGFYGLWVFLFDIPLEAIVGNKAEIRRELMTLFEWTSWVDDKPTFDSKVLQFKKRYITKLNTHSIQYAQLGEVSQISSGDVLNLSKDKNEVFIDKAEFFNFRIDSKYLTRLEDFSVLGNNNVKSKILLKKGISHSERFDTAIVPMNVNGGSSFISIVVHRYGLLSKYVLAVLSSRFTLLWLLGAREADKNGHKNVGLSELKSIEIPIIPIDDQEIICKIVDLLLIAEPASKASLFYQRLLDATIFEIFHKQDFDLLGIEILFRLKGITSISAIPVEERDSKYFEMLEEFSSPENALSADLLKILTLDISKMY